MTTPSAQGLFVLLGPDRSRWPEPLGTAIELGDILLERVSHVHTAAAQIAKNRWAVRGLLLDPAILTLADLELLRAIKRRIPVTMIMLPLTAAAGPAARHAADLGILSWEEAPPFFAAVARVESMAGRLGALGSDAETDNLQQIAAETLIENNVTSTVEPRYDDFGTQPLLTEEEMRALLGTPE